MTYYSCHRYQRVALLQLYILGSNVTYYSLREQRIDGTALLRTKRHTKAGVLAQQHGARALAGACNGSPSNATTTRCDSIL
jgi:hypothetical protein